MSEAGKPARFRFSLRTLFIVTTLLAIPLVGSVLLMRGMDDAFEALIAGQPGEVSQAEDWPYPLKRLSMTATENGVVLNNIRVYCVANGMSVEYVWRLESSTAIFDLIKKEYSLSGYAPPKAGRFRPQDHLPDWWGPQENAETRYYAANLGNVGEQLVVLHDELNQVVYVHFYDNW